MDKTFPVQIQADNQDANDSHCVCMCHVFDVRDEVCLLTALSKQYLHVIAWDANGEKVYEYDNR